MDSSLHDDIWSQPESLRGCLSGRLVDSSAGPQSRAHIRELKNTWSGNGKTFEELLQGASRVLVVASGSSYHAAMMFEYVFESFCKVPVEVDRPGEFRYRDVVWGENELLIALTQSGETPDVFACVELAKTNKVPVIVLCNNLDSSICKLADCAVPLCAGLEKASLATKTLIAELAVSILFSFHVSQLTQSTAVEQTAQICMELARLPDLMKEYIPTCSAQMHEVAKLYRYAHDFLFMGRGYNFPIALEGAQKVKELCYIHAEGYPAAEMKHGPIALIDPLMPVVMIAIKDSIYLKIKSNIEEVRARGGELIVITNGDNDELKGLAAHVVTVPHTTEVLGPLLTVIPMQQLAFHIGVLRRNNVDKPRHLEKVVSDHNLCGVSLP